MTGKPFPARLHVLLARDAPVAVVIRRGPAKQVATLRWDRRNDEIKLGQWLKGRIYEHWSDISPDGKHMIYAAGNGRWTSETGGFWTAVSRAPWLKALDLWGDHGMGYGGYFVSDTDFWLISGEHHQLRRASRLQSTGAPDWARQQNVGWVTPYVGRLCRDGWTCERPEKLVTQGLQAALDMVIRKHWILRKHVHAGVNEAPGKSVYWENHSIVDARNGAARIFDDWEWAGMDKHDIVYCAKGCLYRQHLTAKGDLLEARLVQDFNGMQFEEIRAPY